MLGIFNSNLINILDNAALKSIGTFIKDALRSVAAALDSLIYQVVSFLYKLFFFVSSTEIFQNDAVKNVSKNFQLLVAVVVMFSLSISLVNYIVNPDNMKSGKVPASKLVTKVITSLILLLTINIVFATAYRLQNAIIENNFVGKLILGDKAQSFDVESMGMSFSKSILSAFITDNPNKSGSVPQYNIQDANDLFNNILTKESQFHYLTDFINDKDDQGEYVLNYNALSIPVGLFISYILLTYVVGVGVRTVQLFYLQIIAPVPILFYVLPNGDDKLKKWTQQCITTYLDLFIRHLIIYLTIFLCSNLLSTDGTFIIPSGAEDYKNWIILALVIAIMLFAKKAPDLIKELFPATSKASGDFGLNLGKQFKGTAAGAVLGAGVGGIAGAATGLLSGGGIGGMIGGLGRGVLGGLSGKKTSDTMAKTRQYGNLRRDHGITAWDRVANSAGGALGTKNLASIQDGEVSKMEKRKEALSGEINSYQSIAQSRDKIYNRANVAVEKDENVMMAQARLQHAQSSGASAAAIMALQKNLNETKETAANNYINTAMSSPNGDSTIRNEMNRINAIMSNDSGLSGISSSDLSSVSNVQDLDTITQSVSSQISSVNNQISNIDTQIKTYKSSTSYKKAHVNTKK
ncbi:unknown [Clostridium sp. CAG:762]|jgi:hypothetical protein|nr:unknown [Clostridium sp. CAG:762]